MNFSVILFLKKMESIFKNETKIKIYANIQKLLNNLKPNSPDKDITNLINQIPPDYLNQKEELMMICQLFAYYARNSLITIKGNAIKLFEKIMDPIKNYLQDESLEVFIISNYGCIKTALFQCKK